MEPRLVDPEVGKAFRERSKEEREVLSDTLSRVVRVLLRGSAADVLALEERLRLSGEAGARRGDLEQLAMQAIDTWRLGSERNDLQSRYATLKSEHAVLRNV
jgi:hypothetical protein